MGQGFAGDGVFGPQRVFAGIGDLACPVDRFSSFAQQVQRVADLILGGQPAMRGGVNLGASDRIFKLRQRQRIVFGLERLESTAKSGGFRWRPEAGQAWH